MNLKELRTIVALLDSMPEETEIIVACVDDGYILPKDRKLENSFKPELSKGTVTLFTDNNQ